MNTGMRSLKVAVIGALLGIFAGSVTAAPAGNVQVLRNLPGKVAKATLVGHHNPNATLNITVGLALQNTAQLKAYMQELRDPNSLNYRHFLTSQQFTELYGPTRDQVSAMETFLSRSGVQVRSVSPNRTLIHASASTAMLERVFHVTINDYKYQGASFFSASTNPSIPASMASYVVSVMGLDNAVTLTQHTLAPVAGPEVVSGTSRLGPSGFSPNQIATAYGWPDITDTTKAAGVTIAIATAFNFKMSDVTHFWDQYGLPHHTVTLIPIDGTTRRLNDETTLDIERSSAMSPGSTILVYSGATPLNQDFNDVFNQIVTDDDADVVSTSWGSPENDSSAPSEASEATEDQTFIQANVQGMVVLAAAGDNGASDGGGASSPDNADFPSSDPYVVAAGGTHLKLNPNNSISSESAWSGAGGADSVLFAEPAYQTASAGWVSNTSCAADFTATGSNLFPVSGCAAAGNASRQSSDMSMDADPATGYSIFYNGRWAVFGGTSFVAPELAGMFAIAVARNAGRVGLGPSLIFCVANGANYATDFNDITTGSNGVNNNHIFDAATGWDHPTGWGTPKNADALITDLVGCIP